MASTAARIAGPLLTGIIFFVVTMGIAIGFVILNGKLSPAIPWFPLPVIALAIASGAFAERRWGIGLATPLARPRGRVILMAAALVLFGVCACILEGAFHGMVRLAEPGPVADGGAAFDSVFAFTIGSMAAVLAEFGFRGIMQTRLQAVLAPWTAIIVVAALNTAAHRWGVDLAQQWLGYFLSLAGAGYLRWWSGSLWPSLIAHLAANLLLAAALLVLGPFNQGALGAGGIAVIAGLTIASLAVAAGIGRQPPATVPG